MKTRIITLTALTLAIAGLSAAAFAQDPAYDRPGPGPGAERPRGMMQRVDTDGDGKITLEEFKAPEEARFAMLDADGDGVISPEEFGARRMARFAERDADGNGVLEGDELPQRPAVGGGGRHRHQRMGDCPRAAK